MNCKCVATPSPRMRTSFLNSGAIPTIRSPVLNTRQLRRQPLPKYFHQLLIHSNVWKTEASAVERRLSHSDSSIMNSESVPTTDTEHAPTSSARERAGGVRSIFTAGAAVTMKFSTSVDFLKSSGMHALISPRSFRPSPPQCRLSPSVQREPERPRKHFVDELSAHDKKREEVVQCEPG